MPESNANKPTLITTGFAQRVNAAVRDFEQRGPAPPGRRGRPAQAGVFIYKAIADESGGTIQAKQVDSTGAVVGDAITLIVLS